ncbi:MAG: transcription repressor NadR [Lachnospiraceae bacterium]|nr:transcription repressor NadR [Lachnospiraceae bacterium]
MRGEERRKQILQMIEQSPNPIPGLALAKDMQVSRQVIVQDIALLRANGVNIISTNRGYIVQGKPSKVSRVFKVIHSDEDVETELNLFVDFGAIVEDVFVYHKVYGIVRADMGIKSRMDIQNYLKDISSGKSSLLKNITSNYHYHTIIADNERILDLIQEKLQEKGFLAKLQDYEPVDFWKDAK